MAGIARCCPLLIAVLLASPEAWAVTPESPEVRALIEKGLKYLENNSDDRLGGKCLIALAFHKEGASPDHPRIQEALKACKGTSSQKIGEDVYSNGLAIIFLAELDGTKNRDLIARFAGAMVQKQKPNGGWGYKKSQRGDTSQTQYAALSYWELLQIGMAPKVQSVESCVNWLLRTQDPSGAWGYQGKDPKGSQRVKQARTSLSMLAAGMGSTMILGNLLGLTGPEANAESSQEEKKPSALQRADLSAKKKIRKLSGTGVDRQRLLEAISKGQAWYDKNFNQKSIESWEHYCYLLYSIERYKSFEELMASDTVEEPDWYQKGFEVLKNKQADDGSWDAESGKPCSTAFAVLFLLRSTQKSIKASLGQGTLVGGRGLSGDLSKMKLKQGRLVTEQKPTEIDALLGMLGDDDNEALESLLSNSAAVQVGNASPEEARRLQQIVKSGAAGARLLSVRALAQLRDLDYVPTFLYAMTDPDKRVVREARDGLRFVSRRFGGYGLPDNFTDAERFDALDRWKSWYRQVRPDAPLLP
ncbi:MAG: hypothetical protein GXP28_02930 [Planctomycetes bacterium]|nr:hypothetical protein [Planctomycetota bacterium]